MVLEPFPGKSHCKERCPEGFGEVTASLCAMLTQQRFLGSKKPQRFHS